jgi:hypothetical protein
VSIYSNGGVAQGSAPSGGTASFLRRRPRNGLSYPPSPGACWPGT